MTPSGNVFLLKDDGLSELSEQPYNSEDVLQGLLADYPRLLAGDLIDAESPRRWVLVSRELGLPSESNGAIRWSVDHLFLDQDGTPTIVEVKRSSDTRIRREVIGQILEYAANATSYWPVESLRASFEQKCLERSKDPAAEIATLTENTADSDKFWLGVKRNLESGNIRMVIVADVIPTELRRIVEFLNLQLKDAEILAMEIRQYASDSVRTLVPRVFGRLERRDPLPTKQWDAQTFFAELRARDADSLPIAERIYDWAKQHCSRVIWGRGAKMGSLIPEIAVGSQRYQLFALWTYGSVEICFQWLAGKAPFENIERRKELARRLNQIEGVNVAEQSLDKRPSFPMAVLGVPSRMELFLQTMNWCVDLLQQTQ